MELTACIVLYVRDSMSEEVFTRRPLKEGASILELLEGYWGHIKIATEVPTIRQKRRNWVGADELDDSGWIFLLQEDSWASSRNDFEALLAIAVRHDWRVAQIDDSPGFRGVVSKGAAFLTEAPRKVKFPGTRALFNASPRTPQFWSWGPGITRLGRQEIYRTYNSANEHALSIFCNGIDRSMSQKRRAKKTLLMSSLRGDISSGADTSLVRLVKGLSKTHEIILVTPYCGSISSACEDYADICVLPTFVGLLPAMNILLCAASNMVGLVSRMDMVFGNSILGGQVAAVAAGLVGVPYLTRILDIVPQDVLLGAVPFLGDRIIVPSRFMKAWACANGVPGDRIRVVHEGIDLDRHETKNPYYSDRTVNVLMVARLDGRGKNLDLGLRAFSYALDRFGNKKDVVLRIAGKSLGSGGIPTPLLQTVEELGLRNYVRFEGFVADMQPLYDIADIFLHTSSTEPFSVAILEAMRSRCAIVTMASGGAPEQIQHRKSGLLCHDTIESIGAGILTLLENPELVSTLGNSAYENVLRFSTRRFVESVSRIMGEFHDV